MVNQEMIDRLVDMLKKLPEGAEITTVSLLRAAGYDTAGSGPVKLMEIHSELFEAAEKAGFCLDMSKHENKEEGLPFCLDFSVRRK